MSSNSAYSELVDHLKTTTALEQVAGILSWDQETMMPVTGGAARAEQAGAMEGVLHARRSDPRIGDWLSGIDAQALDLTGQANLRAAKRDFDKANKVPAELAQALAKAGAEGQRAWAGARAEDDFAAFAPFLSEILSLKRQEAAAISDGGDLYDALLADFEPGMQVDALAGLLGELRPGLTELRAHIEASSTKPMGIDRSFPEAQQMEMAHRLAKVAHYDFEGGRIDRSVHPFSTGYRGDARITTRVNPDYVFDCLYSTLHEVGHSNYEQGRDPAHDSTPAGGWASMGVHESQSRMMENQIGRSRPFMEWLYPQMIEVFGDIGVDGPDALYAAVNKVGPGYIRTEADEVHYNLHILMRFDLERALVAGDLQVDSLEAAWNDRFEADFGVAVDKASHGVLQDVHWSVGLFGYFPTYSLGNIYAGCLFAKMKADLPGLENDVASGDLARVMDWLRKHIHRHGTLYAPDALIENACGAPASVAPLMGYLQDKFTGLYPH